MARRRRSKLPQLSAETVRNIGAVIIVLIGAFLVIKGTKAFLGGSDLFRVKDIVISRELKIVEIPELDKVRGRNIFSINVGALETKIRRKYPALADLKVMRRLPDRIVLSALKRDPFARVSLKGRLYVVDVDGYLIGNARSEDAALSLLQGVRSQRAVAGRKLDDPKAQKALDIIRAFEATGIPATFPLRSVDVSDKSRIICMIGDKGMAPIDVIMDDKDINGRIRTLRALLSSSGIDLEEVRYMDLRFAEPVLGKKAKRR